MSFNTMAVLVVVALMAAAAVQQVYSHGFANDPPSRSSLWRYGYDAPVNYDDNQLWCGGVQVQHGQYGGKCGPCGDSYGEPRPRANENTGLYGGGIVTKSYQRGSVMPATFTITANHEGWIQFALCKLNTTMQLETEECFVPLKLAGTSDTRYYLPNNYDVGETTVSLQLPPNQVCSRCVLQWHYYTANTWGVCQDGSEAIGCGPQETFRSCSDIAIW